MERRRTLIVSLSYPARDGDASGHFVRHQALGLAAGGDAVVVAAPRVPSIDGRAYGSIALGGDALFSWPGAIARARGNPARLLAIGPIAVRMRRAIARAAPFDRAFIHWLVPTAFPLTPRLDGTHVEAIAHGADVRLLLALPRAARESIADALIDRTTRVRFVAHALLDGLLRTLSGRVRDRLAARAYVEPMPFDVMHVAPLDPPPNYVVWVGRDIPSKRLDLAIEACSCAHRPLVVIGAHRPPRPDVRFLGILPRAETLGWIARADLLLSTSEEEGAPTAVREARALRTPVLATPAGDLHRWSTADPGIQITTADRLHALLTNE